ncbi:FIGNL1-interacting regulator of recombination and mitosis isoform X2 [Ascaphus truei]|uniref:FIGNL1-interacting regulator of recombination and mitosis isoform X2 n=1 Tax=Ascaphus truei TaxID=8439 RepID=UPI003F594916
MNTHISQGKSGLQILGCYFGFLCDLLDDLPVCTGRNFGVFNLLTQLFLPHVGLLELEQNVFSQVLPKAVKLFDELIDEISSQATGLSSQNMEVRSSLRNVLQNLVQWLEALTACVHHVCSLDESVTLENIHTLPSSVLHVLRAAFTHCKDSDSVYNSRLHLVSDLLQALFKEAVSLQKQLMELLDKTTINATASETDTADMVSVLHTVLDICSIVSNMDHALHANTWKFIIKQSLKHQALIESQLRHHDIINGLCDDILLSFQSCLQLAEHMQLSGTQESTDQRLFQKTEKLCRFFANSLVHYTKEFMPFLSGSCTCLHQLYLQMHSKFPPSLYATSISEAHKDEIACVVLVVLDPLILQLLSFRPFVELVLGERLERPPEHHFPQCLLLMNIMEKLPSLPEDVQTLWCTGSRFPEETPRMSIFRALFQSFMLCSPELSLPVHMQAVMVKGQAPADVTFYQYVCVHLCAYIVSLPPALFSELERSLLDAVLSYSMMTSLLAMDVWCFLARYGTAELCAHHIQIVAHVVKSCPGDSYQLSHLSVLLRRLLFLMAADHQAEFIKAFPPLEAENLKLWQHMSLSALPSDLKAQVKNDLLTAGISQSRDWLTGRCTLGDLEQLNASLSALLAVCNSAAETLDKEQQSALLGIIGQLWPLLGVKQISSQPYLQQTFCLLLSLLAFTVQSLAPPMLTQVVALLSSLSQDNPAAHVRFAVLDFLAALGKIFVPQDVQALVLPKLSSVFSLLLADHAWLIKQHTLEAFTQFAEETSHEEVVPESLGSGDTKSNVIAFLNKTVHSAEAEDTRVDRVKEEKKVLDAFFARATQNHVEEVVTLEPSAKRAKQTYSQGDKYETEILAAERALTTIQSLLQESPTPAWLPARLHNIQTLLTTLQTSTQQPGHRG